MADTKRPAAEAPGTPSQHRHVVEKPTVLQVSRPYLSHAELSYLHASTIPDNKKIAYNQRKHQMYQFLFQVIKTLKFPLRVLSLLMNYYQRYYLFNNFDEQADMNPENDPLVELEKDPYMVAYTCLFLATKNEDCIKKLRDIQNVANKIRDIDGESRNHYRNLSNSSNTVLEIQRKVIMSLEFKLLQVLKFDFLSGAANVPSVDQLVVMFAKQLGLDYKPTFFAWLVAFDIMSTPLSLVIPPHCIALAIVIVTLNLKPVDLISKYGDIGDLEKTGSVLENIDSMRDFRCPELLVNEGIVYVLDYYVHQMKFLVLNDYLPAVNAETGKEQIFKFMGLKSRFNDLTILSEQSVSTNGLLKQDNYLRKWDYKVGSKGAARFMIGNKRRRFEEEFAILRPPKPNKV
ncbi:cyclin-like protein [Metschnikowia bicuspidata var. bicuspidata NRRL YB-4993]|uniref:Cyclin-like protein n=1 Tax=Metschnikowia bicuspidata var. bicuspidata NRRL YB-4993 TaxID=869754 RepID=A0A1A0HBJ6_9ASCO|nr:cyclin-like protein [Metschnikowia bicuspidata var. bicuspidata NRRL YB-4993]OBA21509.1 cyclin-like protein [Metschnikowia bicuspidata var. bicuspidata NRRL YB-4993]